MERTEVFFILDASSSMGKWQDEAMDAFASQIDVLRKNKLGGQYNVTVRTFGSRPGAYLAHSVDLDDLDVDYIRRSYRPRGMTALTETVIRTIEEIPSFVVDAASPHVSFLMLIVSDGWENHSGAGYKWANAKRQITKCYASDQWTFGLCTPPDGAEKTARDFGIPMGNVHRFYQTAQGYDDFKRATTDSLASYSVLRSQGVRSVKSSFFAQTNPGTIGDSKLKRDLDKIDRSAFKVHQVDKGGAIRPFIQSKGIPWVQGRFFYELTKKEDRLQPQKEIVLMDRTTGDFYGGPGVRDELGIPEGVHGRVEPGNHGNWRIFIQSQSVNRELVRGSKLLQRV